MTLPSPKTLCMIAGLASAIAAATGCFWLSARNTKQAPSPLQESCEGLEGALKAECEARRQGR